MFSKVPYVILFIFFAVQKKKKTNQKDKGQIQKGISIAVPNYIQSKELLEVVAKLDSTLVAVCSL